MSFHLRILIVFLGALLTTGALASEKECDEETRASTVVEKLEQKGHKSIVSLERREDGWRFTVSQVHDVDPETLAVSRSLSPDDDDIPPADALSLLEILKKVEEAGYTVTEVEFDDGKWEVEAIRQVELNVHPKTGAIEQLKDEEDDD